MKTLLISFLLTILVVTNVPTTKVDKTEIDVEAILAKSEKNFSKASTVTKVADQQQKAKMVEMHETVAKLEQQNEQLQVTLKETTNELQAVKEVINTNAADTGEQFNLFPEN
jgi:hypothetical protein